MKRVDKKRVVVTVIVLITALQAGLAGVAGYGRKQADGLLGAARAGVNALTMQVENGKLQAVPEPVPGDSKWSLLENADVSGTLQIVQGLGDAAGITIANAKAGQSATIGRQSFQISGTGTPAQVCTFIASVEGNARLIVVESGRFLPECSEEITFELGLATYHTGGGQ